MVRLLSLLIALAIFVAIVMLRRRSNRGIAAALAVVAGCVALGLTLLRMAPDMEEASVPATIAPREPTEPSERRTALVIDADVPEPLDQIRIASQPTMTSRPLDSEPEPADAEERTARPADGRARDAGEPELAWDDVVDEEFEVDIYPSSRSAARGLARLVVEMSDRFVEDGQSPGTVQITSLLADCPDANLLAQDFADVLRALLKDSRILINATADESKVSQVEENGIDIVLQIRERQTEHAPWSQDEYQMTAPLIASISSRRAKHAYSTRFVQKPWVEHFSQFLSARPGQQFRLIRSKQFANNTTDAHQTVTRAAAKSLAPIVRPDALSAWRSRTPAPFPQEEFMYTMNSHVRYAIADRFVQKLTKSYGHVYREAILIDVQSPGVAQLRNTVSRYFADASRREVQRQTREASIFGTLIVVLAGLVSLYVVLNLITRGYYRSRLVPVLFGTAVLAVCAAMVVRAGGI